MKKNRRKKRNKRRPLHPNLDAATEEEGTGREGQEKRKKKSNTTLSKKQKNKKNAEDKTRIKARRQND
jgi:hypothetical protein